MTYRTRILPWSGDQIPLMLAPMQGLTNQALRHFFMETVRPDVVFTEFLQVRPGSRKKGLGKKECTEISAQPDDTPLVVQLMGRDTQALVNGAITAQEAGAQHININMGCPYGRMQSNSAGGALLKDPNSLPDTLHALREATQGSFSVKIRSGHEDPRQIFSLLPMFEEAGVDFLILHPRTVVDRYATPADHSITEEVCRETHLPVIANGDINKKEDGIRVLAETKSVGLMLGRGAIADPWLFLRLRNEHPAEFDEATRRDEIRHYLFTLLNLYQNYFCGDMQAISKLKEVLNQINDPWFNKPRKAMRKCKELKSIATEINLL